MGGEELYADATVLLDQDGLTLRRYYFPLATSKRIPYRHILTVDVRPMSWSSGKARGWGSGDFSHWFPLDLHRARKNTLLILDVGGRVKPAFSPDDSERVLTILQAHIRPH